MNSVAQRNFCIYVTGFPQDTHRNVLKNEFSKFGKIEKLFLEASGRYAKIFYDNKESCDLAIHELNNTTLNWQVQYFRNKNIDCKPESLSSGSSGVSNMANYRNCYDEDEDFSENFDYCNVHGQPLTVLQADTGDLYINLKDIRKTGFALFRRDTFDSILVDKRQIGKEFELHLLSEAKNYILKNRVAVIREEDILKTIERCKSRLLGENSCNDNRNTFGTGRSVASSSRNISIIADVHQTPFNATLPTTPQIPNQRPPKTLPKNFIPNNTQRNETRRSNNQDQSNHYNSNKGNRDARFNNDSFMDNKEKHNEFVMGFNTPKQKYGSIEKNLNVTNSYDSKRNEENSRETVRKPNTETTNSIQEKKVQQPKEDIGQLTFKTGSTYQVLVVFTEDNENIYWVQKNEDADVIEDMLLKINEIDNEMIENVKPVVGQLVIAQFEGAWCRGRVTSVNPPTVHFIDYGNKSTVEFVKPLPDKFKNTPALSARIKVNRSTEVDGELKQLNIKVKQRYDDGTYLVNLVDSATATSSESEIKTKSSEIKKTEEIKEKHYFKIPKPMGELKNGTKVMLIDMEGNKFLVRTKECAQKCKEITDYIKNLDKSALTLTNVKVGQLILCSMDGLVGLYRAVVTKRENEPVVTVKYIDFPGEDDLTVKSLRNVDEFLANEPSSILLTPEYKSLKHVNDKNMEVISKLCQNKEKLTVILSDNDFDLQFADGTLLSQELAEVKLSQKSTELKKEPISEGVEKIETYSKPEVSKSSVKISYNDMGWINIKPGSHSFMCYRFKDLDDITMIDSSQEVINYFEVITGLEVSDEIPYSPEELEMCLVLYKGPDDDEANWFRATVLSVENDCYDVCFVDFGNQEKVKSQDIRKLPSYLKDIPMLGINCELVGLPNTPQVVTQLKELLPEGEQVDVIVKGRSKNAHHKYQIEIPTIYKILQAEGLY